MSGSAKTNRHATALVAGNCGLLILGPSGAGKTSLALDLVSAMVMRGRFARLVADDQVYLSVDGGRLCASTPPAIAGLAEIRPLGPRPMPHLGSAVIDLVVELAPSHMTARMIDDEIAAIEGVRLPLVRLPEQSTAASTRVLLAMLEAT